jgi:hypothetical protein
MSDVRRIDPKRHFAASLQCGTGYRYARCINNIWARVRTSALPLKAAATVAERCVRFGSRRGLMHEWYSRSLVCVAQAHISSALLPRNSPKQQAWALGKIVLS